MVIDSSAFIAILQNEPESRLYRALMMADPVRAASASTIVETSIAILARQGESGLEEFRAFLEAAEISKMPFADSARAGILRHSISVTVSPTLWRPQ